MKKLFVCILIGVLFAAAWSGTLLASPGSESDPLVSKSYVDGLFNQIMNLIQNQGGAAGGGLTTAQKNQLVTEVQDELMKRLEPVISSGSGGQSTYTPVFASAGQVVIGDEGCEIILRSGKAVGYVPVENGIVNATDGSEVFDGNTIKENNLLIIPRSDGRGVLAVSDSWFIVKGSYTIR